MNAQSWVGSRFNTSPAGQKYYGVQSSGSTGQHADSLKNALTKNLGILSGLKQAK
jgi:hypothetical protein